MASKKLIHVFDKISMKSITIKYFDQPYNETWSIFTLINLKKTDILRPHFAPVARVPTPGTSFLTSAKWQKYIDATNSALV